MTASPWPFLSPFWLFDFFAEAPSMLTDPIGHDNCDGGQVLALATKAKRPSPPHKFASPRSVPACETISGFEQIERACITCGLVRITVMQGEGYRAYRWGNAPFQFDDGVEPECPQLTDRGGRP